MTYVKNNLLNKKNIFFILLCIYPWLLISGPFLSDLIAIVLSFYFLYSKFSQKNFDEFKNIFFILFILFCLYISINSLFIGQTLLSIKPSVFYFRFGLFALAVVFLIKENESRLKYFSYSLIGILFVLFVDSIFQKIFGVNLLGTKMHHSIRVSSLFGDELILGSYTVKILPIALAFVYFLNIKKNITISLILIFIGIILILLSAEKAALAMVIIFLIFFVTKLNLSKKKNLFYLLFSHSLSV